VRHRQGVPERLHDGVGHEAGDVATVPGHVLDERRGDMGVGGGGDEEDRLGRAEIAVEQGHGRLNVQIGAAAQALDDDVGPAGAAVVGQEAGHDVDLRAGQVPQSPPGQYHAGVEVEQVTGLLGGVPGDGQDDPVEHGRGAPYDVDMTQSDGVEGSGVHGQ